MGKEYPIKKPLLFTVCISEQTFSRFLLLEEILPGLKKNKGWKVGHVSYMISTKPNGHEDPHYNNYVGTMVL